jgi:Tol biopolymer transport system component
MTGTDVQLGDPTVSRDGTKIAFVKVEGTSRPVRDFLYTIDADGSGLRRIMELDHTGMPTRGAKIGSCHCAWSPDNRSIVMWGTPKGERRETVALDAIAPRLLFTVEVATGQTQRWHTLGGRRPGRGVWGSVITAQAWAPDSRRFVYMDDTGHARILDTVTGDEDDLGIGTEPTWSADGAVIAVKLPHEPGTDHGKRNEGDYIGIDVRSRGRTRLLENPRSAWLTIGLPAWRTVGYFGPAVWSPDGQFLIVQYHGRGEEPRRYVIDRKSGEAADVSREFIGASLGGRG